MTTFAQSLAPRAWSPGRHAVRCVGTVQETQDVRTFCFVAEQPCLFLFKPGQFVTLELVIDGETLMRSYTISSSPTLPTTFSVTIKRVPGGKVSNWLHDQFGAGQGLIVHGPAGRFHLTQRPADKVLLLSGGVGITPLMSMARWLCDTHSGADTVFVHSARTPGDIIYHRELRHMAARNPAFQLHLVCERQGSGEAWAGYRGYLGRAMLELMAADFLDREIFCCGPAPYMAAVRHLLDEAGFDRRRYHEEAFVPLAEAPQPTTEQAHVVHFARSDKRIRIAPGETVHAAAGRAGVALPKACGMGICGTCRVLKQAGEVRIAANGGISEEELAEGYILSCCSEPLGDVVIDA
ncbi:ferredoxin [Pseudomonas sp. 10-1B]|uniref:hybrid-cluster NAD(P)-dependent oxidoreductase n=1 Tax=Pseudomonas sp. 10-1B TaxID=1546029 RepID=UPI00061E2183|nr:hybrid-cluster NAD(P)-dependent oxidoreductase [Pseudomonas sp. 10-1B]KIY42260.1 ferredoxin [Pseudomonas sp. 10-1B]